MTVRKKSITVMIIVMLMLVAAFLPLYGGVTPETAYASRSNKGTDTSDEWSGKIQTGNLITIGKGSLVDQGWNLG